MSEIEPGYYWARWKRDPWEIVKVVNKEGHFLMFQDEEEDWNFPGGYEFGPHLEPPEEDLICPS